jgi:hypothetical protein
MNSMQKFACGVLISNMNKNAMRPGFRRALLALGGLGLIAGPGVGIASAIRGNPELDRAIANQNNGMQDYARESMRIQQEIENNPPESKIPMFQ